MPPFDYIEQFYRQLIVTVKQDKNANSVIDVHTAITQTEPQTIDY